MSSSRRQAPATVMTPAALTRGALTRAALIGAALIGVGAAAGFGYGFLHYRQIAAEQAAMLRRVEIANADLQDALDRLRDDNRKSLQQFNTENDRLQLRLSELEQQLASPKPGLYQPPNVTAAPSIARTPGPVAAPSPGVVAPALAPAALAPAAAAPRPSPAVAVAAAPADRKNFNPPGWVPDFFSAESDAFVGSSMQPRPPPPQRKARP